ncbi:MAG TPA: hypothetical protein EYP56_21075, partial [Planctomycetaceae bacterium]|nr:hypothetical protein [Planctomycetaceae bacterium]
HGTINCECIRRRWPESIDEAGTLVAAWVDCYNHERLQSAIGYVTPLRQAARAGVVGVRRTGPEVGRSSPASEDGPAGCNRSGSWLAPTCVVSCPMAWAEGIGLCCGRAPAPSAGAETAAGGPSSAAAPHPFSGLRWSASKRKRARQEAAILPAGGLSVSLPVLRPNSSSR